MKNSEHSVLTFWSGAVLRGLSGKMTAENVGVKILGEMEKKKNEGSFPVHPRHQTAGVIYIRRLRRQQHLGRASIPAAVMRFGTSHHQQWILHNGARREFITQDEKHVTFATLNKMNGSLSHLHPHTFLWLRREVCLIYWEQDKWWA